MVGANRLGNQAEVRRCDYVNDADAVLSSCANLPPLAATGVRVTLRETHGTFFIQAVPGAPNSVTTAATATAHVQRYAAPTDGPFIVCGRNTQLESGGTMNILVPSGGTWSVNPAADRQVFKIHGPQIEKCDAKASRFKGVTDNVANRNRTAPDWFTYTEGDSAGTLYTDVPGVQGCKAGQVVNNCVAFLPVSVNDPAEVGNNKQLWTVTFLPFFVTEPKNNEHTGMLVLNYIVSGAGTPGWVRGTTGAMVIRLTA